MKVICSNFTERCPKRCPHGKLHERILSCYDASDGNYKHPDNVYMLECEVCSECRPPEELIHIMRPHGGRVATSGGR